MQAVRRSNRLRNIRGRLQTPENNRGSASTPNLQLENMGNHGHNVVNNGNIQHAEFNPDLGDFVPIEQGQGDARGFFFNEQDFIGEENFFTSFSMISWIKGLALVLIITLALFLSDTVTSKLIEKYQPALHNRASSSFLSSSKYSFDDSNYYPSKCNAIKQINIDKSIRHINRKLRKLNKGVIEFMQWRNNMTTETSKVKNDTLLECSKQLEKFNTKIEEALTLYDADKVGMIDYALESAGGYVTSIPDTTPCPSYLIYDIMGLINIHYPSNPRLLIQPGTLPGQCFAFKGQHGRIRIQLAQIVNITAVTIEHANQNLVPDMNSAPKDFKVYGLEAAKSETGDELGFFTYRLDKRPLQTFYLQKTNNKQGYEHVELRILTNQGNSEYTCVYRFRVHGNKIESPNEDLLNV